ncbi:Serine/threonine-protein kinase plk4 [Blastocladiella emersonii ATCC 22665]|nr:Serine/threonine-protein kinase plk4 [Blastocladiella emersonii ATCC 22665]
MRASTSSYGSAPLPPTAVTHHTAPWLQRVKRDPSPPRFALADFRLGEQLGAGTSGAVSAAFPIDERKYARLRGVPLAIKSVAKADPKFAKRCAMLERERVLHPLLVHPSIVRMYGFDDDGENVYFLLERCGGGSLQRYLERRGRLTEPEVRHVLRDLVPAICYLAEHGFMHRDLKPANILLTDDGHVKIADFGLIARVNGEDLTDAPDSRAVARVTPAGKLGTPENHRTLCGTASYLAPEVAARNKAYSKEVDVWSLGVITYEMLVGTTPFKPDPNTPHDDLVRATLYRVTECPYTIPDDAGLSNLARDLLACLIQRDPSKRLKANEILKHHFFNLPAEPLPPLALLGPPPPAAAITPLHQTVSAVTYSHVSRTHQSTVSTQSTMSPYGYQPTPPDYHHHQQYAGFAQPSSASSSRSRSRSSHPPATSAPPPPSSHRPPPPAAAAPQPASAHRSSSRSYDPPPPPAPQPASAPRSSSRSYDPPPPQQQQQKEQLIPFARFDATRVTPNRAFTTNHGTLLVHSVQGKPRVLFALADGTYLLARTDGSMVAECRATTAPPVPPLGPRSTPNLVIVSPQYRDTVGLPARLQPKHQKLLAMVQYAVARSPCVILDGPRGTAQLMCNMPDPDLQFRFHPAAPGATARRMLYGGSGKRHVIVYDGSATTKFAVDHPPPDLADDVRHVMHCRAECLNAFNREAKDGRTPDPANPLRITTGAAVNGAVRRSRPPSVASTTAQQPRSRRVSAASSSPGTTATATATAFRGSSSGVVRSDSGFGDSMPTAAPPAPRSGEYTRYYASPPSVAGSSTTTTTTAARGHRRTTSQRSAASSSSPAAAPPAPPLDPNAAFKFFIPGTGWCTRSAAYLYTVLFLDGSCVTVHGAEKELEFAPAPAPLAGSGAGPAQVQPRRFKYARLTDLPPDVRRGVDAYVRCLQTLKEQGLI